MITKHDNFQDSIVGADYSESFSIDTETDVIFDILRNSMYKDKIGAVCREIASNSRDANRESNSDKPVEIEIISPNKLLSLGHLSISFKDYGTGISPNKMSDIFLKYGVSDKRNTNKLTGGFGLGSKTPFCYNDTFTVITVADFAKPVFKEEGTERKVDPVTDVVTLVPRYVIDYYKPSERRKYKYTAMLDSSGKGKMVLFNNELTKEETGTQIIVPIKTASDRYEFETKVLKYTQTWREEVTYSNFVYSPAVLEVAYEDTDVIIIYKTDSYQYTTMQLLIDGIPYPLDTEAVKVKDTVGRSNSNYLTVLKFETGDLAISANRESVQYDEETCASIVEKTDALKVKLDKLTKSHVAEQDTYLDACVISYYVNRASSQMANPPALTGAIIAHSKSVGHKFKNLTWKRIPTVDKFQFKHHTAYHVTQKNGQNKYEPVREFHLNALNANSLIYYGDARKNSARNANIWEDEHKSFYIIKPDNLDSKEGIHEFMDFIFTFDIDFNLYSDLKVVKNASGGAYQKKSYVTLNIRDAYDNKNLVKLERKTFLDTNGEDFNKTVYLAVGYLGKGIRRTEGKELRWLESRGYEAIVIRQQDYNNWFSNTGMQHYKDIYDIERAAYEKKIIDDQIEAVEAYLLYYTVKDTIDFRFIDSIRSLLPKSASNVQKVAYIDSDTIDIVKKELKFNYDGLEAKIKRIFGEQYPLVGIIMSSYKFTHLKRVQILENYLKTI